jgi:2-oxoacid:acceptor oxidoreductase gamma subunit (pyruvate/2-ketoisovalerate family)
MTLEIRLHGRGGQGGVTCAKILAAIYAKLGKSVQTFGDYAGERSGAPVRAYTRVSDEPIANRNKVYNPDELLVLDPTLLGDDTVAGLVPGGLLLLNTSRPAAELTPRFGKFRLAIIDATAIARRRSIGTRSVIIVNTTITGAYARAVGLPFEALENAYRELHMARDLDAAREAYEGVAFAGVEAAPAAAPAAPPKAAAAPAAAPAPSTPLGAHGTDVLPLTQHVESPAVTLKTGSWRTQLPQYVEHLAPCNAWCPAGNDVVQFIQTLYKEGEAAAAAVLGTTQPLASICGRVCPAPCMEGCNRREYDGSVNIRALERWIGDRASVLRRAEAPPAKRRNVAILGSGPAGLSAACELARAGHRVTIYEGEKELGGVLRTGIPTYRLPREVLDREISAILALGVETRCGTFLDAAAIAGLGKKHDAVIVAAGLARATELDAPCANLPGVEQGLGFLHRVNMEGGDTVRGHVVVLGGGNTAMDCARSALRAGAAKVTVAYRRTHEEMPAIREEIEEAHREGIGFLFQRAPVAFHGNGRVAAIELAEVEMGEPDSSGRRRPVVTKRTSRLTCDRVLLAIGQSADRGILPANCEVSSGRVYTTAGETNLFVAGDFATGDGTVTHAIGDGRRAAGRVLVALGEKAVIFERPDRTKAVPLTAIRRDHFPLEAPSADRLLPVETRIRTFDEANGGIDNPGEAGRCFSCGHCTQCDSCLVYCPEGIIERIPGGYEVDLGYCKGCGICVAECPRSAMEMTNA